MKHPKLSFDKKFRLRTTLVMPFVVQIVTAVGLVGYLSFRSGQQAVNTLATQVRNELTARIGAELGKYLDSPHNYNRLNTEALARGELNLSASVNAQQFRTQVEISPFIYSSYCGDSQGQYLGAYRLSNQGSSTIAMSVSNTSTKQNFHFYGMNQKGERLKLLQKLNPYDPRKRPWWKSAIDTNGPIWSEVYLDFASGLPTITASTPIYDLSNNLVGVCATDVVLLKDLRKFLATLSIGKNGQAFVIDRAGRMLSSSTKEPLTVGSGKNLKLIRAKDSEEPLVKETVNYLKKEFNSFDKIQSSHSLDYKLNGKRKFVQVLPLNDNRGIDWLIVVVVPESDFMEQIDANNRNTILLCSAALTLAIAIGILTSRWVTQPILRVSRASDELAKGDLNQQVSESPIVEIDTLANSFNSMAGQLKDSFTSLEQKNEKLRIAEENFRSIFENALEGIFQSSPEGRFISINPALAKIYGYDSPDDAIKSITNISEQLYVDPPKRAEFKEIIEKHDKVKNFEVRCYCKDGTIVWTEIDARIVKDNNGKVLYCEGIVQDITERKNLEDELRRQLKELKVEIDHKKREQEVATLTESSYFQEVQQEMAEVDLDEFWD